MRLLTDMLDRQDTAAQTAYITLSIEERRATLHAAAELCQTPFDAAGVDEFILRLRRSNILPARVAEQLDRFAQTGNPLGFLLIRGLPVEEIQGFRKATALSETLLLASGLLMGEPLGYADQRGGAIIQNIRPQPEDAHKLLGSGSAIELIWHTEDAHAEVNCDLITLLCLRGDPDAHTLISQVDPDRLSSAERRELAQPQYVIRSDESYAGYVSRLTVKVLDLEQGKPIVRYDPPFTDCLTAKGSAALAGLTTLVNEAAVSVTLRSGDLLVIDNKSAVHARTAFRARFDDTDRWIQRIAIFTRPVPAYSMDPVKRCIIRAAAN